MAPPVKEPITFLGWIEDLFRVPASVPSGTWALVRKDYDNKILVIRVNQFPAAMSGSFSPTDFVNALVEGPESISDIKGIVTSITVKDLVSSPIETVKKLGQDTFNQIIDLDELSSDRRADMLARLTRGQITDGEDQNIPNSNYQDVGEYLGQTNAFGVKRAGDLINTLTRTSKIQLLKDVKGGNDPNNRGDWEDRRIVEENESRITNWKSYNSLAMALTSLGSNLEDPSERHNARDAIYQEYTRATVQELGIKLDSVLGTNQNALAEAGKAITNAERGNLSTMLRAGLTVEDIIADDALTAQALGINIARLNTYTPKERSLLSSFLKIEDLNIRTSFYNSITQEPEDLIRALRKDGARYSSVFGGKDYAVGMRVTTAAGAIIVPTKQEELKGYVDRSLFKGNIQSLKDKNYITAYAQIENDYKVIRNGIRRQINAQFANLPQTTRNSKIDRALARLEDARMAAKIGDDLFYVATVKEILENIEQGSFLKAAIQSTRFLNLIPGNKLPSGGDFAQILSTGRVPIVRDIASFVGNSVPTALGLKFTDKKEIKIGNATLYKRKNVLNPLGQAINKATGIFDGHVYASWAQRDAAGNFLNKQKFIRIKTTEAQGLFGEWSVHNVLKQMDSAGFWPGGGNAIPFLPPGINSTELLTDFAKLDNFYTNLRLAADWYIRYPNSLTPGRIPPTLRPYIKIVREFGIVQLDQHGIYQLGNIDKIFEQKALFDLHGKAFLERIADPAQIGQGALRAADRWDFIKKIGSNGTAAGLTKKYIGLLGTWNNLANAARNYLYQNIILGTSFGTALLNVPIVGTMLKLGGGEIGLLQVVNSWNWIKNTKATGGVLKSLTRNPRLLARIAGRSTASFAIRTLAKNAAGRMVLKIAGNLLLQASNIVTGGLSWAVAAFGDVVWTFGKNALKLDFKRAADEADQALKAKWEVIKKVLVYPLTCTCGCLFAPIGLIIIVIMSQLANLTPFGGGTQEDLDSRLIHVTKTSQVSGNKINYTITIKNISGEGSVEVETINDRLSFTYPCDQGGSTVNYTNGTSWISSVIGNFPKNEPKTVADQLTYSYSVENTVEGTYFNTIEVTAVGETGRSSASSVVNNIGKGGCITCPSGWPFSDYKGPLAVTQGPNTRAADSSHGSAEAVDIAPSGYVYNVNNGQKVVATHRGIASFSSSLTGYGNLAIVRSEGGYSTYYAHLDSFDGSLSGKLVDAGTVLGIMGNIGNSTGTHLHYEFRTPAGNPNYECIAGHKLKLVSINGQSYIPKTIPVACFGAGSCNISVP